jgi:hypothetical protein
MNQIKRPSMSTKQAARKVAVKTVKGLAIVHSEHETMLVEVVKDLNDVLIDIFSRDATNISQKH